MPKNGAGEGVSLNRRSVGELVASDYDYLWKVNWKARDSPYTALSERPLSSFVCFTLEDTITAHVGAILPSPPIPDSAIPCGNMNWKRRIKFLRE